jgi:hypothetical protein
MDTNSHESDERESKHKEFLTTDKDRMHGWEMELFTEEKATKGTKHSLISEVQQQLDVGITIDDELVPGLPYLRQESQQVQEQHNML